ncbi:beta-glucoside-specific PTS transporter subunit IIABC [Fusibacter ferrireducens]|uniref:PTS glucose transporter subunit IIA n=1 Tax=Fusibacter ferrireducens TaxID=2785058 RepID=A0ABR9ZTF6_9FIRM|nr:beta-glucoside-specific PTS transporter subunit IIABC [Fusibacter ferrireducens]MBF4693749.1 PTS glucose transporter subunit IIA [Fusibacter ferrireducens]
MKEFAQKIIDLVGGSENILSVTHCATRLRFRIEKSELANTEALKALPGVITALNSGGQYQVVIGEKVVEVYDAIQELLNRESSKSSKASKKSNNFLDLTTSIFGPTMGVLAASGILRGLIALAVAINVLDKASSTYLILNAIGMSIFYFYPVLLGYTSAKKFGIDPFIGLAIGATFMYPDLVKAVSNEPIRILFEGTLLQSKVQLTFMNIPVVLMNYTSSVIPVIVTTYFASKVSKTFEKFLPKLIRKLFLPCIVLVVSVLLGLIILGPIVTLGCNAVGFVITNLFEINNVLTSAVLGFFWQTLVMFGLHKGLLPISINNLSVYGYDYIYPVASIAAYATGGAVLAVFFKTKNEKMKDLSIASFFQILVAAITEPAIYGITIPLKKPFIAANLGAAVGSIVLGIFNTKCYFISANSLFGIPSYIEPNGTFGRGFWGIIIGTAVAAICGFIFTYLIGFEEKNDEISINEKLKIGAIETVNFVAPVSGRIVPLEQLKDKVFSSKSMGDGIAIRPESNQLVSPVEGTVEFVFPSGHAVGIKSKEGVDLLLHIGIDSASLEDTFKAKVAKGDRVKKGDVLVNFDLKKLESGSVDSAVIIVVTNSTDYMDVMKENVETVNAQDNLLTVIEGGHL